MKNVQNVKKQNGWWRFTYNLYTSVCKTNTDLINEKTCRNGSEQKEDEWIRAVQFMVSFWRVEKLTYSILMLVLVISDN